MELNDILLNVKSASKKMAVSSEIERKKILENIAKFLDEKRDSIKNANKIDVDNAKEAELSSALIDRLVITDKEIDGMIKAVMEISMQKEVVGEVVSGSTRPNGLKIRKVRVPLGIVGIIYESRPNVTIDSAALCIKSGNWSNTNFLFFHSLPN